MSAETSHPAVPEPQASIRHATREPDRPGGVGRTGPEDLPVTAFAVVMGLAGTAVAWQRAARSAAVPLAVGDVLAWWAAGIFVVVAAAYGVKAARHMPAVRAEWNRPPALAFVPTSSIALLILALALLDLSRPLSAAAWWAGATLQVGFTVGILGRWIADPRLTLEHVHPGWFIPVVGNLVVPLAGVAHAPARLSWFFFSVGLAYWLVLLPIVLARLVVGGVLPPRLAPTVAILVAPPAVAALAWVRLGGTWSDPPATILTNLTIFQLLVLAIQARGLWRLPFALSSWAYSFPLAAAAATLLAAADAGVGDAYGWAGGAVLTALTALVTVLIVRTVVAVRRHEICRPETGLVRHRSWAQKPADHTDTRGTLDGNDRSGVPGTSGPRLRQGRRRRPTGS